MRTAAELVAQAEAGVENLSVQAAAAEMAINDVVVLDVREPGEWQEHIADAVPVPRGLLEFAADPSSPRHHPALDPEARVIVYCRSGARSALACQTLQALGFDDVANLHGGFTAWKAAGLPITDEHQGL